MPKSKQDARVSAVRVIRARHSADARSLASTIPSKSSDKQWGKKLELLQVALRKKFKTEVFTTVANGSRSANISAQPSGWREVDDLLTGETDPNGKTGKGSGLGGPRGRTLD